ncbi:MAG: BlaI/MecI/CopY family transcriptional regulator [Gemmatimonadaceae bacterium]|nr:BlaI/MecI/CopY family transcriptional regulator [Gemmatimonadaceae bacterium]
MSPPQAGAPLGERELDVMAVLWELGSGTVSEVLAYLGEPLAYTTILTILRNLEAKQCVRREEEGRGHRYFPVVEQQAARRSALSRLLDGFFDGSPHALLAQLVRDHGLSGDELQALAKQLRAMPAEDKSGRATPKPRKGTR